jgi:Zn finger protein HypA/HybF involved in hydrogenase expression
MDKEIDLSKCGVCAKDLNFNRRFGGVMFGDEFEEAMMRMAYKCHKCGSPICRECAEKSRCPKCGGKTFDVDVERIK